MDQTKFEKDGDSKEPASTTAASELFNDFFKSSRDYFNQISNIGDRSAALAKDNESAVGKVGGFVTLSAAKADLESKSFDIKRGQSPDGQPETRYLRNDGTVSSILRKDGDYTKQLNFDANNKPTEATLYQPNGMRFTRKTFDDAGQERIHTAFHADGKSPSNVCKFADPNDPKSRYEKQEYRPDGTRSEKAIHFKNVGTESLKTVYASDGITPKLETKFHPDGAEDTVSKFDSAGRITEIKTNMRHASEFREDGTRSKDIMLMRDGGKIVTDYKQDGETSISRSWFRPDGTIDSKLIRGEKGSITEEKFATDGKTVLERGFYTSDFSALINKFNSAGTRTEESLTRKDGSGYTTLYKANGIDHKRHSSKKADPLYLASMPSF